MAGIGRKINRVTIGKMYKKNSVSNPSVTVIMSVKNAEARIESTMISILSQKDVNLEMIVVNDGSTDSTARIVDRLRRDDNRIKLISRENKGLTISLIEGCELAQGEFLARHDANDHSLPGRLSAQANALLEDSGASFCSTYVRHVTKEGVGAMTTKDEGIIHGSVMMRKSAYKRAGGYRRQFYYAQDIDLWSRLKCVGRHIKIPSIYYEALLFPESISGTRGNEQRKFCYLIKQASAARRDGKDERIWLDKAHLLSQKCRASKPRTTKYADGAYFIGSCLAEENPSLARQYFKDAIVFNSLHLRARLRLARIK